MNSRSLAVAAATIACLFSPAAALAQPVLAPTGALSGDDPDGTLNAWGDAYAAGSAVWGDWLFAGAPRETASRGGLNVSDGAVYAYKKDAGGSYVFQQKLTQPGSSSLAAPIGDRLGGGIAAAGGWLFIGSANDQDFPGVVDPRSGIEPTDFWFAGQVHVYKLNGGSWDFVQTLTAPAPKSGGSFGTRTQSSHIAVNSSGNVVVIGELNNFDGGVGQLHIYKRKGGAWKHTQSIDAPLPSLDSFGDALVFANDKYLVAGGADFSDDATTVQGYVFVYQSKGKSGQFFAAPNQTIAGAIVDPNICFTGGTNAYGEAGLDAAGGVVVVADPCVSGAAGAFTGKIDIYRVTKSAAPLALETVIEGDEADLYFGANSFGARNSVAVSGSGARILVGSAVSPTGALDPASVGADVRVFAYDGMVGWSEESNLASATVAEFRLLGDSVLFADDETAFVRENNFLDPIVTGLKGQGLFYDLTP